MALDFNITAALQVQADPASISRAMADVRRQAEGTTIKLGVDAGSSASALSRVTSGAQASSAALRQARDQAQALNVALSGTVSLGTQSAGSLENLAQQAGLAARRFVAMVAAAGSITQLVAAFKAGVSAAVAFDLAMNKVQQVSSETPDAVRRIRSEITTLATSLGVSSSALAETAVTLKQAGLNAQETAAALRALALTDLTPSFGSQKEATEGFIAAIRQFKVEAKDYENTLGSMNAVAAAFAVESKDLIAAVQKAGGAFKQTGGDLNEFMGVFTSVRATTRESAEEIATGLRTVFTRFQRADTVQAVKDLGINLRFTREEAEALGESKLENQFVGAYEAVKRLSQGLDGLKTTDPRYAAVIEQLGGYRQISRVIPLLKQFEDAERAKNVAIAGGISLQAAAEQRQEALANKLDKVRENYLAAFRAIVDTKGFEGMADAILRVANGLAKVLEFAAPLVPVFATLAAVKIGANLGSIANNAFGAFNARVGAPLPPAQTRRFSRGNLVPGQGDGDTVPALLTPGEFVMTKAATSRIGPDNLRALMDGQARVQKFARGGMVGVPGYADGDLVKNLTPAQWKLVAEHMALAERAGRKKELGGIGDVDPGNLAQDALYKAATAYDPEKGSFKSLFNRTFQGLIKDALQKKETRESREGGIADLPKAAAVRGAVDHGGGQRDTADVVAERELLAQAKAAAGGDLSIGSAQGKRNRGGINYQDVLDKARSLGVRGGGLTTEELTERLADRIRARMLENRAGEAQVRRDNEFVGPPLPPGGVAAPGAPGPDPRAQRLDRLNALRRDGTRAVNYSDLKDLGLPPNVFSGFIRDVRTMASEMGKLDAVTKEATQVVVRMKGGMAEVVGLRDLSNKVDTFKATGVNAAYGVAQRLQGAEPTPGVAASFGGFGGVYAAPLTKAQVEDHRLEQERKAQERAYQDLNVQRAAERQRDAERAARAGIPTQDQQAVGAQDLRRRQAEAVRRQQEADFADRRSEAVRRHQDEQARLARDEQARDEKVATDTARRGQRLTDDPERLRAHALATLRSGFYDAAPGVARDHLDRIQDRLSPTQFAHVERQFRQRVDFTGGLAQGRSLDHDLVRFGKDKDGNPVIAGGYLKAQADKAADARIAARGGAGNLSAATQAQLRDTALTDQLTASKRELISAQTRLLKALGVGANSLERYRIAAEEVERAFQGQARVVVSSTGALLGTEARVNAATAAGVSAPGVGRFAQARGAVGGFFSSVGQGIGNFNARVDGATGGRLGNSLLGLSIATPLITQGLDRPGASETTRGIGGALNGGVLGATAGLALGGPFGAVVGGLTGALVGLTTAIDEAAKDIAQHKLNDSLTGFADSLKSINNALAGGGSADPALLARNFDQLTTARFNQGEVARRDATHTFGGLDVAEFNRLKGESDRRHFANQLPDVIQFLSAQGTRLGRDNVGNKDVRGLAEQVLGGNNGRNRAYAGLVADVRQISPLDVRKELEKTIASAQQAKRAEDASKAGRDAVETTVNSFGRLLLAVDSSADSLSGLQAQAQALGDAFDGTVSAIHVTGSHRAGQLGRFDRGALAAFDAVGAATGGAGLDLRRSAGAVDDVARVLPGVLAQAANRHGVEGQDVGTSVTNGVLDALGVSDKTKVPAELQRVLNAVRGGLAKQTEGTEKRFGDSVALDATKEAERLLSPVADPLKELGSKIAQKLEENANRFIDGLAVLARRTEQAGQAQDAAAALGVGAVRTRAQVAGARAGRANQALDFLSLRDLEAGQTARQERLAGVRGPAAFNVEGLARRLEQVQKQIPDAVKNQQEVAQRTGGRGPAFEAAAKGLTDLQSQSARLQSALKNLSDVTTRTAEIQDKLNRLQQDKEGRRGLLERFLTADPDQAAELNRGLALANQANQQGSFDGFLPADAKAAIDFLKSAGGATLNGFQGAPRADDLLNKLLDNTAGGIAKGDAAKQKEEADLQDELVKRSADAAKAAEELAKSLQRSNTDFFTNLVSQQQQFFNRLVEELAGIHLADKVNQAGKAGVEAREAEAVKEQASLLKGLGFTSGGQVKANADSVTKYAEATSVILDQQKKAAGVGDKPFSLRELFGPTGIFENTVGQRANLDKYLQQNFGDLNEGARTRVIDKLQANVGGDPYTVNTDDEVRKAIAAEYEGKAGPGSEYEKAVRRQTEAYRSLEGVKGFDFNKLNQKAATPEGLKELAEALDTFRDGKAFRGVDENAKRLADDFRSLSDAVKVAQVAIDGLREARRPGDDVVFKANGGSIFQPRGSDTVPAMLTPGEFVVRRQAAEANRGLLERINQANGPLYRADGGMVGWLKTIANGAKDVGVWGTDRVLGGDGATADVVAEKRRREELDRRIAERQTKVLADGGKVRYRAEGGLIDADYVFGAGAAEGMRAAREKKEEMAKRFDQFVGNVGDNALGSVVADQVRDLKANPPTPVERGPKPRVVAAPVDPLEAALRREAALNPYGQSAMLLAGRAGGAKAQARTYLSGQIADFNRRSYAANYRNDPVAEASAAARQTYNQKAYQRTRRPAARPWGYFGGRPMAFASGGMVPGFGDHDSVHALLTPGEFVLNRDAVQRAGAANVQAFNHGGTVYKAGGGGVSASGGGQDWSQMASAMTQFSQAAGGLGSSAQAMAQAATAFAGPAQALAQALEAMPRTINGQFTHAVNVTMNGAEVLAKLSPEFQALAVDVVKKEVAKAFKQALPDVALAPG